MALASQSERSISRSRYMYQRRKNRGGRFFLIVLVLAAIGLGVWNFWPEPRGTIAQETLPTTPTNAVASALSTPAPTPMPTPEPSPEPSPSITETTVWVGPVTPTITPEPTPTPEIIPTTSRSQQLADAIQRGETDPITARATLTQLLVGAALSSQDEMLARAELNRLGELLLFDPSLVQGDPFATRYVVQPGDSLARIAKKDSINAEWGLIQTINNIASPDRIRVGQSLKVPVGTFHAVVSKRDHVMDMYLANDVGRIIVASFPIGLGAYDGTPIGRFRVRPSSKVKNPPWRNPRTGQVFQPEDPANPIGERWIGLEGTDADNRELLGYGIHGTIDSASIGSNESMGCVRMLDPHVRLVYDMLISSGSTIEIRD